VENELKLTSEEAYKAMYFFLERWWEVGGKDEDNIANIIGSMALLADGNSADAAMLADWKDSVKKVLEYRGKPETGDEPWMLRLTKK
jgi:hypothetical protein